MKMNLNYNTYSQAGAWERGLCPVGCVSQRTVKITFKLLTNMFLGLKSLSANLFFMSILLNGTLGNVPLYNPNRGKSDKIPLKD